jgi:hypothetical protein
MTTVGRWISKADYEMMAKTVRMLEVARRTTAYSNSKYLKSTKIQVVMKKVKDIKWFKDKLATKLEGYELNYKFYNEGDFGSLNQVEFNSKKIGGNVDFWGLGWLGIFVWDYERAEQLLNILLEPHQEKEKDDAFEQLEKLL